MEYLSLICYYPAFLGLKLGIFKDYNPNLMFLGVLAWFIKGIVIGFLVACYFV